MAILTGIPSFQGEQLGLLLRDKLTDYPTIATLGTEVIDAKKEDYILTLHNDLRKITTKRGAACGLPSPKGNFAMYTKKLEPVEMEAYNEFCDKELNGTIFAKMKQSGVSAADITPTEFGAILQDVVFDAVAHDLTRILFLGDTALVGNVDYNQFNGIYKKLKVGTTDLNNPVSDAGAVAPPTLSNIVAELEKVYQAQSRNLRQVPNNQKKFWVTEEIYEVYAQYLTTVGVQFNQSRIEGGLDNVTYKGIPLVPLYIVSKALNDFASGSPLVVPNPHRIILTKPDQHFIATDYNSSSILKMWYSDDDDKNKILVRYLADYNFKYGDYSVIAGF
jgi:hypothetical protein